MPSSFLKLGTSQAPKSYKGVVAVTVLLPLLAGFAVLAPMVGAQQAKQVTYINGYPTINGKYVDCNGNYDTDPAHHTTDPNDRDPGHHVGQDCPVGTFIYNYGSGQSSQATPVPSAAADPAPVPSAIPAVTSPAPSGAACDQTGQNTFSGCYYTDQNFGSLGLMRNDQSINFDWGGGSPDSRIPVDHFSVQWQGNFNFEDGEYVFTATGDDGISLFIDGINSISKMFDQGPTAYTAVVRLAAGQHNIRLRYYENGGGAVAKLGWAKKSAVVPVTQVSATPAGSSAQAAASGNPLAGAQFYRDPNSNAQQWVNNNSWQGSNAALMQKIASQPNAVWLGGWNSDVAGDAARIAGAANAQGQVPVFILYNIPNRDCGGYSAGGTQSADAYRQWVKSVASGIGSNRAVVVLEPDSLSLITCLSSSDLQTRYGLLSDAVSALKSRGNIAVYIDAGHSSWISAQDMAGRLKSAGVANADGFALNISNFTWTNDNIDYGQSVSSQIGNKHFIVDTSRNGQGPAPDGAWCNPSGRGLGSKPTTSTGNNLVDAFIWGKDPGGSDGTCNGGPSAGVFWPDYALGLAARSAW